MDTTIRRTPNWLLSFLVFIIVLFHAGRLTTVSASNQFPNSGKAIQIGIGPDTKTWRLMCETNTDDSAARQVIEMRTGMNYWDGEKWSPSDPTFESDQNGFVAAKLQAKVRLANNINVQEAVSITTPDGIELHSTPLAIALYNTESGDSLVIGTITNSQGVLINSNQVVFQNAFANGVCADIVYTIDQTSFSQDVVIVGRIDPQDYGFSTNNTQIQIISELYKYAEPDVIRRPIRTEKDLKKRKRMAKPDFLDNTLGFGQFVLGLGRAYTMNQTNAISDGALVGKDLVRVGARSFLVESVEFSSLADQILALPDCSNDELNHASNLKLKKHRDTDAYAAIRVLDQPSKTQAGLAPMQRMARASVSKRSGVVIDYLGTIGGTISSSQVFSCDVTYCITGPTVCNGAVTIESGTVLKYANDASITINNSIVCSSMMYKPAILTSIDDDSVGDSAAGSSFYHITNSLGAYANPALLLNNITTLSLNNLCFRYCKQAISVNGIANTSSASLNLADSQLVGCIQGITITITGCGGGCCGGGYCGAGANVSNTLFDNVLYPLNLPVNSYASQWGNFVHCTMAHADRIATSGNCNTPLTGGCSVALNFMNCAFGNVTNLFAGSRFVSTFSGNNNGFYSSPSFGSSPVTQTSSPFDSRNNGKYYLTPTTKFRRAGTTTELSTAMLADLSGRSTYPPFLLTNLYQLSGSQLGPQVFRYAGGAPDLGVYYAALDYIIAGLEIPFEGSLDILPGTAIAFDNKSPALPNHATGFIVDDAATLTANGTVTKPITFTIIPFVQEGGTVVNTSGPKNPFVIGICQAGSGKYWSPPSIRLRFVNSYLSANDYHLCAGRCLLSPNTWTAASPSSCAVINMQDCSLRGGMLGLGPSADSGVPTGTAYWANNLFERVYVYLNPGPSDLSFTAYNNLFRFGIFRAVPAPSSAGNWVGADNMFDQTVFSVTGNQPLAWDTNVYILASAVQTNAAVNSGWLYQVENTVSNVFTLPGTPRLVESHQILISTAPYVSGPLGNYYMNQYSSTYTGMLLSKGSRTVKDSGLYHYTTRYDRQKEGVKGYNGKIDIGLHYIASDSAGKPVDSDNDGVPDYIEDVNGNGTDDSSEAVWDLNILVQPSDTVVTEGNNGSMAVVAQGSSPSYQWYFNGTAITGATQSTLSFTNVQRSNAGDYTVQVTTSAKSFTSQPATLVVISAKCQDVLSGLVGWWTGDRDLTEIANGHASTAVGTVGIIPGKVGQSLSFDGSSYVSVVNAASGDLDRMAANPMTVEMWAYRSGSPASGVLLAKRTATSSEYQLGYDSANGLYFQGGGTGGVYTHTQLPLTNWVHLAATFDGSSFKFYTNGVLAAIGTGSLGVINTLPLTIGNAPGCTGFAGMLDEISLYNRALSGDEVASIYNASWAGKFHDVDENGIPDSWEYHYFNKFGIDPHSDTDGNGWSNIEEYENAIDPTMITSAPHKKLSRWYFNNAYVTEEGQDYAYVNNTPAVTTTVGIPGGVWDFAAILATPSTTGAGLSYNIVKDDIPDSLHFSVGSFLDVKSLAGNLKAHLDNDAVSKYLYSRLSSATTTLLAAYQTGTDVPISLQVRLAIDMDIVCRSTSMYRSCSWPNLRPATQALADAQGSRVMLLNRMLLEDAYPQSISKYHGNSVLSPQRGTVSFWFRPAWNSGTVGSTTQRLIDVSPVVSSELSESTEEGNLRWSLQLNPDRTKILFLIQPGQSPIQIAQTSGSLTWKQNEWHQIVVTYSSDTTEGVAIYVDGVQCYKGTDSIGLLKNLVPNHAWRIWIGGRYGASANGAYDYIETFNYPQSISEVGNAYSSILKRDTDLDGIPDIQEAINGTSMNNADSNGDKIPDGWAARYMANHLATDTAGNGRSYLNNYLYGWDPEDNNPVYRRPSFDVVGTTTARDGIINIQFSGTAGNWGPAAAGTDSPDHPDYWNLYGSGITGALSAGGVRTPVSINASYGPFIGYNFGSDFYEISSDGVFRNGLLIGKDGDWVDNIDDVRLGEKFTISGYDLIQQPFTKQVLWPVTCNSAQSLMPYCYCSCSGPFFRVIAHLDFTSSAEYSRRNNLGQLLPYPNYLLFNPFFEVVQCPTLFLPISFNYTSVSENRWSTEVTNWITPSIGNGTVIFQKAFDQQFQSSGNWHPGLQGSACSSCDQYPSAWKISASDGRVTMLDGRNARTQIAINSLSNAYYRVYFYGGQSIGVDSAEPSVVQVNDVNHVLVPKWTTASSSLSKTVNYSTICVPVQGHMNIVWTNKNAAIRAIQLVPLSLPGGSVPTANAGAKIGVTVRWAPIPTALSYAVLRGEPGQYFSMVGNTEEPFFQDTKVSPNKTYSYLVLASNELGSAKGGQTCIVTTPDAQAGAPIVNYPPVLNYVRPLKQAYKNSKFVFGAAQVGASADGYDAEGAPLQFAITELVNGTLEWTDGTTTKILTDTDFGDDKAPFLLKPGDSLTWTPPTDALDDIVAFRVRASDGVQLSAHDANVVINVKESSTLLWWGYYGDGQSGGGIPWQNMPDNIGFEDWNAPSGSRKVPTPILVSSDYLTDTQVSDGQLKNVIGVAGSMESRAALTVDGRVWTWGLGLWGELGDGHLSSSDPNVIPYFLLRQRSKAAPVPGLTGVVSIAAYEHGIIAVRADGTVWGWGASWSGELGAASLGIFSSSPTVHPDWTWSPDSFYNVCFKGAKAPVQLPGFQNIVSVALGSWYHIALSGDGRVFEWTDNSLPTEKAMPEKIVQIANGGRHCLALTESGQVVAWGYNAVSCIFNWMDEYEDGLFYKLLGDPAFDDEFEYAYRYVPGLRNVSRIAADWSLSLAVLKDGSVVQWGGYTMGSWVKGVHRWDEPTPVVGLSGIVDVSGGDGQCLAVDSDGRLFLWGTGTESDTYPESAISQDGLVSLPVQVPGINSASAPMTIIAGYHNGASGAIGYVSAVLGSSAPENLSALPSDSTVTLTWDKFRDVPSYVILRATSKAGPYSQIATVEAQRGSRQQFIDETVGNYVTYFYKIAAHVGTEERTSNPVRTEPMPVPAVPAASDITVKSLNRAVSVQWKAKRDTQVTRIYRATELNGTYTQLAAVDTGMMNTDDISPFTDIQVAPDKTYYYKLQSVNAAGESALSAALNATPVFTGATGDIQVANLLVNSLDSTLHTAVLTWDAPNSPNGSPKYMVWRAQCYCDSSLNRNTPYSDLKWAQLGITGEKSFKLNDFQDGECYSYAVSVIDDSGVSPMFPGQYDVPVLARMGQRSSIALLQQQAGDGSIYLKWSGQALDYQISMQYKASAGSSYGSFQIPSCASPIIWPDSNLAEFWLTDLQPGYYKISIIQVFDDYADSNFAELPITLQVLNSAHSDSLYPLQAVAADNRVTLSWYDVADNDAQKQAVVDKYKGWEFKLFRSTDDANKTAWFPCGGWDEIADGAGLWFTDTNVVNGQRCRYMLIGIDPLSNVSKRLLGDNSSVTNDDTLIVASAFSADSIVTLHATPLNAAVQLSWTISGTCGSTPLHYEIYAANIGGDWNQTPIATVTSLSYVDTHLINDQEQTYYVRAVAANGDSIDSSAVSTTPMSSLPLPPPSDFNGILGDNRFVINWLDLSGSVGYSISNFNTTSNNYVYLKDVSSPQFSDVLISGTSLYRYRIAALAGQGGSAVEIAAQPLSWTWPPTGVTPSTDRPAVTFKIERLCGDAVPMEIARISTCRYLDVRTQFVSLNCTYRITALDNHGDPVLDTQGKTIDIRNDFVTSTVDFTVPPAALTSMINDVSVAFIGLVSPITTPTNITLQASITTGSLDANNVIARVEFYANGLLLGSASQSPFSYTWINPPGTLSGQTYTLVARVVDNAGRVSDTTANLTVMVQPVLAPYTTSVTDYQLPGPGIGISLDRTYDSRDGRAGMLGKGWKTPWDRARLVLPDLGAGWFATLGQRQNCGLQETAPHLVEVTLPDGSVEHFRFFPVPKPSDGRQSFSIFGFDSSSYEDWVFDLSGPDSIDISFPFGFFSQDGVGNLTDGVGNINLTTSALNQYTGGALPFTYCPTQLNYTTSDGTTYAFGNPLGSPCPTELCLIYQTDRFGNKITYDSSISAGKRVLNSISLDNGRALTFSKSGNVITVNGPSSLQNPIVTYGLDADGNLSTVTRPGGAGPETTTYTYCTPNATTNLLKQIINPDGIILLENTYSPNGFLASQTNAVGVSTSISYSTTAQSTQPISGALLTRIPTGGGTTVFTQNSGFGPSGELVSATDENGKVTSVGYDQRGRKSYSRDAAGHYKFYSYDDQDRLLATIDENGNASTVKYASFNQPSETTDASGVATSYTYYPAHDPGSLSTDNPEGTLESVSDAEGGFTTYTYNSHGQLKTETHYMAGQSVGFTTQYDYYQDAVPDSWAPGDLHQVTDPAGNTTVYTYYATGYKKTEARSRKMATGDNQTVTTTYAYDNQNRLISTSASASPNDARDNHATSSTYNSIGKVATSTDAYGRVTTNTYDVLGNLLETKYPDRTVARTVFDGKGRVKWQQDRTFLPDDGRTTGPATLTQYDAAGRVTNTTRCTNVQINLTTGACFNATGTVANAESGYRSVNAVATGMFCSVTNTGTVVSITRSEYDDAGRVHYSMNSGGIVTEYLYDNAGRRTNVGVYKNAINTNAALSTANGDKITTSYGYDANGNQAWVLDASTNRTDYFYDGLNRLILTILPPDTTGFRATRKTIYNSLGQRVREIDEAGVNTLFDYDSLGRLILVVNDYKDVNLTEFAKDQIDQFIGVMHGVLVDINNANALDRLFLGKLSPDTRSELNQYFPEANVAITDKLRALVAGDIANMLSSSSFYDATAFAGKSIPTATQDLISANLQGWGLQYFNRALLAAAYSGIFPGYQWASSSYGYDAFGNLISQIDANLNVTRFEYDAFGRRTKRTLPDGKYETTVYGQLAVAERPNVYVRTETFTDCNNNAIQQPMQTVRTFDVSDRLATVVFPNTAIPGTTVSYFYYPDSGAIQSVQMTGGVSRTVNYYYDPLRRLTLKDTPEGYLSYSYYSLSQLQSIDGYRRFGTTVAGGVISGTKDVSVNYGYDFLGRLNKVTNNTGGAITSYGYDPVGNLDHVTYPNGIVHTYAYTTQNRLLNLAVTNASGTLLRGYAYGLNILGLRTNIIETLNDGTQRRKATYTYDGAGLPRVNRLTQETDTFNSTQTYGYDSVGNRTSGVLTYTFNGRDEILTTSGGPAPHYDFNGNTDNDGGIAYKYDAQNRLVNRQGTNLVYDADGNRISKVENGVSTFYLVDDRNPSGYPQVLAEYPSVTTSTGPTVTYTYGLSLISQNRSASIHYYCYDGQGSVRQLTDTAGAVTDTYDYDAFGTLISPPGTTDNNMLYCGEYFDRDLGMYYLRARWYKPEIGRMWTQDKYEGYKQIPASLHKYTYAECDPVNNTDPSGNSVATDNGIAVHRYIGDDFTSKGIPGARFSGPSIITILEKIPGFKVPAKFEGLVTALFPDLTDTVTKEVYEIKPDNVSSIVSGEAQLEGYIDLFNAIDPTSTVNPWHRGTSYKPPLTVPINALNYAAAVGSPITPPGMILYKVFSVQQIVKRKAVQVGAAQANDVNDSVGISILDSLLGAF